MAATHIFCLPDLGEGLTEAELVAWHVEAGQPVLLNQPLVEVETAKAGVELPNPYPGTVAELHAAVGDVVAVGAPLVTIAAGVAPDVAGPPAEAGTAGRGDGEPSQAGGDRGEESSGAVLVGYGTSAAPRATRPRVP